MKKNYIFSLMIFLFSYFAMGAPAQVVIIRHGEKPADGNELNEIGWQRANALPNFFENNKTVMTYGTPVAIYAGAPSKPGGSIRSIQTITPYANKIGLPVNKTISKDNVYELVNEIMNTPGYDDRTVVICWEHSVIPEMARDFGATSAPMIWDSNVFDRAWVIRFNANTVSSFENIPEHVLATDSI